MEDFIALNLKLLELERSAEHEQMKVELTGSNIKYLEQRGVAINKLYLEEDLKTGYYGSTLMKLQYYNSTSFKSHSLTNGDLVGVSKTSSFNSQDFICTGVIDKITYNSLRIALDKNFEDFNNVLAIKNTSLVVVKMVNEVTYKRLKRILSFLSKTDCRLISLFTNSFTNNSTFNHQLQFFNQSLNDEQMEAVHFCLSRSTCAIIHGPPGTGKTTTVVEVILQEVLLGNKVLACAPSNVAVDNLLEGLLKFKKKLNVVRLGHTSRVSENLKKFSLNYRIKHCDANEILLSVKKEIEKCIQSRSYYKKYGSITDLKKELRMREKKVVCDILLNADVILSTNTSAVHDSYPLSYLPKDFFQVAIIDECAQALEVSCWIPLVQAKKCILAGDHEQLPPTIYSNFAAGEGLSVSLMERLIQMHGSSIVKMLKIQYRMNSNIMSWSSKCFYSSQLTANVSVAGHLLCDLKNVESNELTESSLWFIDTAGCDLEESDLSASSSKCNDGEADIAAYHVNQLLLAQVSACDIGIITPYNLQIEVIRDRLVGHSQIEIKSVDGFQGREKEAIVISLVRSNKLKELGFLKESRRLNVAITRARRHLCIISDSSTISHDQSLSDLVKHLYDNATVKSAFEYINNPNITFRKSIHSLSNIMPVSTKKIKKPNIESSQTKSVSDESIRKQFFSFLNSIEKNVLFSTALTGAQRALVHELSEKHNLSHISEGKGSKRFVKIFRVNTSEKLTNDLDKNEFSEDSTNSESGVISRETDDCQESFLSTKDSTSFQKPDLLKQKPTMIKKRNNKKVKKPTHCKTVKCPDSVEDEDVIAQFAKLNSLCNYHKCSKSVTLIFEICKYCKMAFCIAHCSPEIHGCKVDPGLLRGLSHPSISSSKKVDLKNSLHKAIRDKQHSRSCKSK